MLAEWPGIEFEPQTHEQGGHQQAPQPHQDSDAQPLHAVLQTAINPGGAEGAGVTQVLAEHRGGHLRHHHAAGERAEDRPPPEDPRERLREVLGDRRGHVMRATHHAQEESCDHGDHDDGAKLNGEKYDQDDRGRAGTEPRAGGRRPSRRRRRSARAALIDDRGNQGPAQDRRKITHGVAAFRSQAWGRARPMSRRAALILPSRRLNSILQKIPKPRTTA